MSTEVLRLTGRPVSSKTVAKKVACSMPIFLKNSGTSYFSVASPFSSVLPSRTVLSKEVEFWVERLKSKFRLFFGLKSRCLTWISHS